MLRRCGSTLYECDRNVVTAGPDDTPKTRFTQRGMACATADGLVPAAPSRQQRNRLAGQPTGHSQVGAPSTIAPRGYGHFDLAAAFACLIRQPCVTCWSGKPTAGRVGLRRTWAARLLAISAPQSGPAAESCAAPHGIAGCAAAAPPGSLLVAAAAATHGWRRRQEQPTASSCGRSADSKWRVRWRHAVRGASFGCVRPAVLLEAA